MATRSWNRVELIGNLTRDPELRYTPSGAAVVTFSIATNRTYVTDGERKEEVDFHRIVAWNKLAELCSQLLKKGNRTFVSGRLQNRSWEGQDGNQRNTTEIVIEDMILLTSRSGQAEEMGEFNEDITPVAATTKPTPAKPKVKEQASPAKVAEEEAKEEKKPSEGEENVDLSDEDLPF